MPDEHVDIVVDELRTRVKDAKSTIDVRKNYLRDNVDELFSTVPHAVSNVYLLTDGVTCYCLPTTTETENAFYVRARKGAVIPVHRHMQHETIMLLKGWLVETVTGDTIGEKNCDYCGVPPVVFPPHTRHGMEFLEDTLMVVIFRPPLEIVYKPEE